MFAADGILGRNFRVMAAGLDGLAMRQRVHAENLANVDTVGYRARTVDFEKVLSSELNAPATVSPMAADGAMMPSSMSDAATGAGALRPHLSSRFAAKARGGSPGVNRNTEVNKMVTDSLRFRILTQQVTNRISGLRAVISEMGRA
jgi:flagellar basal-body rod protein FlgB